MSCAVHDWYFDTPCPKCAATVAVTEPPPAEAPLPELPAGDALEIPVFLRRNPDNTFVEPEPWSELKPLVPRVAPPAEDIATWSNEKLHEALSANLSISDRQPILREITHRENKSKTYARLDKAGFTKPKAEDTDGNPE